MTPATIAMTRTARPGRAREAFARWLASVRYLLAAGVPAVVVLVAVTFAWPIQLLTLFWSNWWNLLAPLWTGVPHDAWRLLFSGGGWLLVAVMTAAAVAVFARWWAPVVHERTARYRGERAPAAPTRFSGRLPARTRAFFTTRETWRRAGWALAQLVLCAIAIVPVVVLLGSARGLVLRMDGYLVPSLGDLLVRGSAADRPGGGPSAMWLVASWFGVVAGLAWLAFVVPRIADVHARFTAAALRPAPDALDAARLAARVDDLTRTRAGAVDAHSAELRRIERDLHDGTQARLVDATMRLGIAERALRSDPDAAAGLMRDARTSTEEAMVELRTVLRTLYPPVLADRGLHGALSGLGARSTVPTAVDVDPDLGPLPAPVEAAAYFLVAESLTNVVKHSGASHADVLVTRSPDALRLRISDDGRGGVDESRGTGVAGMRRRVEALDGWLDVTGPLGGPTIVAAEIPCPAESPEEEPA